MVLTSVYIICSWPVVLVLSPTLEQPIHHVSPSIPSVKLLGLWKLIQNLNLLLLCCNLVQKYNHIVIIIIYCKHYLIIIYYNN